VNVTRAGSETTRLSIELSQTVQALVRVSEDTPAIPASEMCAVLRYLAAAEFGLAQAFEQLAGCVRRSADDGLFWAAESAPELAGAAKGLRLAARRLSRGAECSTDVATLLADARADIALEGRAVSRRLLDRRSTDCTPDLAPPPRLPGRSRVKTPPWSDPVEVSSVDPAEWISPAKAALLLEISPNTLTSYWVTTRVGPRRYRVDGAYVYRRSEVESVRDRRAQVLRERRPAA
jgi:hypothetical protein